MEPPKRPKIEEPPTEVFKKPDVQPEVPKKPDAQPKAKGGVSDVRRRIEGKPQLKVVEQARVVEQAKPAEPEPVADRKPVGSKLGIAPGLVGEIADFMLDSAMYPSVKFATASSVILIGTLIGRRIAGPSGALGTGTHLYAALIGPTGIGKEHYKATTKLLLTSANAAALIGPGRFKSGAGIVTHLIKKPVSLCVMDEFGSLLARLTHAGSQWYHIEELEILRELWGISWGRYDSPEGASSDSEAIQSPALSIIGMSTPIELYKACKSQDVTSGFLNRWWFIEEKAAPPYQKVEADALMVPQRLKVSLSRLYQPISLLDQVGDGTEFRPSFRMGWGPGAEEIWDGIRQGVEREADERRKQLFWRSPEKTVRIATNVAAGCFSKTVNKDHMEWAHAFVKQSDETLLIGVQEYMEEEKYEFGEMCREVIRRMRQAGGSMRGRDVKRSFQNNMTRKGGSIMRVMDHLVETEQVIEQRFETGGRPTVMYNLPQREKPKKL